MACYRCRHVPLTVVCSTVHLTTTQPSHLHVQAECTQLCHHVTCPASNSAFTWPEQEFVRFLPLGLELLSKPLDSGDVLMALLNASFLSLNWPRNFAIAALRLLPPDPAPPPLLNPLPPLLLCAAASLVGLWPCCCFCGLSSRACCCATLLRWSGDSCCCCCCCWYVCCRFRDLAWAAALAACCCFCCCCCCLYLQSYSCMRAKGWD